MSDGGSDASLAKSNEGQSSDEVFFVAVHFKGTPYEVPVQAEDSIASIFDFVQEALDFPRENCKLIHKGKVWRPDYDFVTVGTAGFQPGSKLMLVASSAHDVSFVQSSRADPLVKGFVEEERDDAARRKRSRAAAASAWGTKQDQEYRFNSIKAEFKFSSPPPFEAEKLLQRLATDPGIIDIMTSRRFKVGILTEMSPVEAQERMAKRGTPNMDLLGYNMNAGDMIVLRLRTDNLKGFRSYHDIMNTLIHELTHNVWGPHDDKFWKLYGELKAQYMRFHRFWSHGGKAADSSAGVQFQGFEGGDEEGAGDGAVGSGFGKVLGGAADGAALSPRSRAVLAAEARRAFGTGPDEPPKPNFLTGDGKWVIMCPCGQVHDPAGCTVAQNLKVGQGAADADDEEEAEPPAAAAAPAPAAAAAREVPAAEVAAAATALAPAAAATAQATAALATTATAAPVAAAAGGAALAEAKAVSVAAPLADAAGGSSGSRTAALAEALGPDLAELEAAGLDGASLWVARFSSHLRGLRRPQGVQQARAAAELLLKLVQNVITNPSDQKFRKVKADNPKIRATLLAHGDEAEALLRALGFEIGADGDGSRIFLLRDASLDPVRLQLGKELLEQELEGLAAC